MNYSGNTPDILEGSLSNPKPGKVSLHEKLQLLLQVAFPAPFAQEQDRPEASVLNQGRLQGAECLDLRKITRCRLRGAIWSLMNYERATLFLVVWRMRQEKYSNNTNPRYVTAGVST